MFRNIIKLFVCVVALFAQACVCSDTLECKYGFIIDLTYHTIYEGAQLDDAEYGAKELRVFLYDENGSYVKTITKSASEVVANDNKIEVPIEVPGKTYSFVVLGDAKGDDYTTNFDTLDAYKVSLSSLEYASRIENMFATTASTLSVVNPEWEVVKKDIYKNNNDIHFRFIVDNNIVLREEQNIEDLDLEGYGSTMAYRVEDFRLSVKDRDYNHMNEIKSDDEVLYTPYSFDAMWTKISKMRLMSTSHDTKVSFKLFKGDEEIYNSANDPNRAEFEISTHIYNYVRESDKYASLREGDNYQYILDVEDTFPITFKFRTDCGTCPEGEGTPTLLSVMILDWEVTFVTPLPL